MKRLFLSIILCTAILLNLLLPNAAQAQPLTPISLPGLPIAQATGEPKDFVKQLESEILPQLESILTPEQREQFKTSVAEGTSFRKAFKAVNLSPAQKGQMGALLKSLPKKDAFAALTPDQKKQLFLKKKEMFKPTPEEIGDKISKGMKLGQEKAGAFAKDKEAFMPSPADIVAKITEKMKAFKFPGSED